MPCKLAVLSIDIQDKQKGTVLEAFDVDKTFGAEVERPESIFTIVTVTDCNKEDDFIVGLLGGKSRLILPTTTDFTVNYSELSLIDA